MLEAVDEGLSSLGTVSRQAIYFHLEKSFRITKQEIPSKIEVFADAIEKIFGKGADFLEILIMKRLHEKTGGNIEWNEAMDFALIDYVDVAKQSFLKNNKTKSKKGKNILCDRIEIKD